MELVVILISLCVERFINPSVILHRFSWFPIYTKFLQRYLLKSVFEQGVVGNVVILMPFIIITALLYYGVGGLFYENIQSLLAVIILIYCFGPGDFRRQLEAYITVWQENASDQLVSDYANVLLATKVPVTDEQRARAISEVAILEFNQQVFSVLFWFIILGPLGAVLYRIITMIVYYAALPENQLGKLFYSANLMKQLLEWLPLRLLGFLYALVGNFRQTFSFMCLNSISNLNYNQSLASHSALLAIGAKPADSASANIEENRALLALFDRALIIWLVAVVLFTIALWVL